MKFGGDAILCFFPEEKNYSEKSSLFNAIFSGAEMQKKMQHFQNIKTPVKKFSLKMKIGIAYGEVLLAGVGNPTLRCDYVFAGEPVDKTSEAEHFAKAGEIILAMPNLEANIYDLRIEKVVEGFYRLLDISHSSNCHMPSKVTNYGVPTALSSYLIKEVYEMVSSGFTKYVGALLDVVSVFMQFKGFQYSKENFDLIKFNDFFATVMEAIHKYDGRLNRISMGDKGSTFLILFGAPKAIEKKKNLLVNGHLKLKIN